jgi:hypothetical protein
MAELYIKAGIVYNIVFDFVTTIGLSLRNMSRQPEQALDRQEVTLSVNGKPMRVAVGTSVAAAILMSGEPCRFSVAGEARAPLCGMGICMECRATINGVTHQRSCMFVCASGMEIVSG